jgi:hypothetical protein
MQARYRERAAGITADSLVEKYEELDHERRLWASFLFELPVLVIYESRSWKEMRAVAQLIKRALS